jgi:hypothetical protein
MSYITVVKVGCDEVVLLRGPRKEVELVKAVRWGVYAQSPFWWPEELISSGGVALQHKVMNYHTFSVLTDIHLKQHEFVVLELKEVL